MIFSKDRTSDGDAPEEAAPEKLSSEDLSKGAALPAISRDWTTHALLLKHWVQRMTRLARLRMQGKVRTCRGVTRQGLPCRGASMANGFCRLHGGSRSGMMAERARSLLQRISHAR
jgi:hypothetical protein